MRHTNFQEMRKQLIERNDFFCVDNDESTNNDTSEIVEKSNAFDVCWAVGNVLSSTDDMDHIDVQFLL